MKRSIRLLTCLLAASLAAAPRAAMASSHMDAPLITLDDAANTTDVYAFVTQRNGVKYLVTALAVYPFEEPGIGPNKYNFDDDVRYEIHVATGSDLAKGRASLTYRFDFRHDVQEQEHDPPVLHGRRAERGRRRAEPDAAYVVTEGRQPPARRARASSASGVVPPNNQGNATPFYNQGDNGENPAQDGVVDAGRPRSVHAQSIAALNRGYTLVRRPARRRLLRRHPVDLRSAEAFAAPTASSTARAASTCTRSRSRSRSPSSAATSRWSASTRRRAASRYGAPRRRGNVDGYEAFVQVGAPGQSALLRGARRARGQGPLQPHGSRQGQRRSSRSTPRTRSSPLLINILVFGAIEDRRSRPAAPISRDLHPRSDQGRPLDRPGAPRGRRRGPPDEPRRRTASAARDLQGRRADEHGPDRLLQATGTVPGGWPNGRRFGDDVVDIAVSAILSDLREPGDARGRRGRRHRQRELERHRLQQGVPVRRDAAERPRHGHP